MVTNRPSGRAFLSPRTFVVLVPFFAIRLLESKAFFHLLWHPGASQACTAPKKTVQRSDLPTKGAQPAELTPKTGAQAVRTFVVSVPFCG